MPVLNTEVYPEKVLDLCKRLMPWAGIREADTKLRVRKSNQSYSV
jgi:hypothetical protein